MRKNYFYLLPMFFITVMFANAEGNKNICAGDVEKFCKDIEKGEGRIVKCLNQHAGELSPSCEAKHQERMTKIKERREKKRGDCKGDLEKFCKEITPGGGARIKCLKEHEAELTPACKEHVKKTSGLPPN